jgi:UDP-3-O-[3-hydroxymyristoyl] glucosamine N-acyltransferase
VRAPRVTGDVVFGKDVVVRGDVRIEGPLRIPDGAILS